MAKAEKTRNANTLTESAYFSKIRSVLRGGFRYWKPMMLALDAASRPYKGPNKRQKKEYKCAGCKKYFKRADVQIDHIIGCGSLKSYEDIVPFIERMNRENPKDYQVLCKPCHQVKTNKERKE